MQTIHHSLSPYTLKPFYAKSVTIIILFSSALVWVQARFKNIASGLRSVPPKIVVRIQFYTLLRIHFNLTIKSIYMSYMWLASNSSASQALDGGVGTQVHMKAKDSRLA